MSSTRNITPHTKVDAAAGLYIHVPFCRSKCAYCDFYSITDNSQVERYLHALSREMAFYRDFAPCFDTIYIGGGTPSLLTFTQLAEMLRHVRESFVIAPDSEITMEINPGDVNETSMRELRDIGVNRVSIGVQSFDDKLLEFLGRRHDGRDGRLAIEAARDAGFLNLGIDLIYGVPGQSFELWQETLTTALGFEPEHLSCYELTLEEGTPLHRRITEGGIGLPGEEEGFRYFSMTSDFLESRGYTHYEVSNFARQRSLVSRHNQKYWDHTPYLGLGPAAHSFKETRRWWNHRSFEQYVSDVEKGLPPTAGQENLGPDELLLEALYFGFRTTRGICGSDFTERYGLDLFRKKGPALQSLHDEGLVNLQGDILVPTRRGLALADRLCLL
jgi:oxygen-independent coproporphyrinogen III oxidase